MLSLCLSLGIVPCVSLGLIGLCLGFGIDDENNKKSHC